MTGARNSGSPPVPAGTIRESEERLRFALDSAAIGDWEMDLQTGVSRRSALHDGCFGYTEPIACWDHEIFLSHVLPEDRRRVADACQGARREVGEYDVEFRVRWPDGSLHWLWSRGRFYADEAGDAASVAGIVVDITERKRAEEILRLNAQAVARTRNGVIIVDARLPDRPITFVNPAFECLTGYTADEVVGRNCRFLNGGETDQDGIRELRAAQAEAREAKVVIRNYRKDGSPFWNELHIAPVRDEHGELTHYLGVQNDISQHRRHEMELARQASHDPLTGLPNRTLLEQLLTRAVARASRDGSRLAVVFLDLDHFKLFNDGIGHATGDLVLKLIAGRLRNCCGGDDTVVRFGGDEFVLLLPNLQSVDDALPPVRAILHAVAEPARVDGYEILPAASAGVCVFPEDGRAIPELLRRADVAMYEAKRAGRGLVRRFEPAMMRSIAGRIGIETRLRAALAEEQFTLDYQPQVNAVTGRIVGVEALLRWHCPGKGVIMPNRFIRIAEETGLIVPIGEWVLNEACRQNRAWQKAGLPAFPVAVNVSMAQFQRPGLVDAVRRALAATGLAPRFLELEITESLAMDGADALIERLAELRALGVQIAIDDFGTGFSSLNHLKRFALDRIKIDQSFVRDVISDPDDAAICRSIIALAHNLRLRVVAEGVENEAQARLLRRHGCDEMQGYWIAMPMAEARMTERLRATGSLPS